MSTNPTNEHREQAREMAQRIAEIHPPVDGRWVAERCPEWMAKIEQIHTAYLNHRLAEVKQVLEGLAEPWENGLCWCNELRAHSDACLAAQLLYSKLQAPELQEEKPGIDSPGTIPATRART